MNELAALWEQYGTMAVVVIVVLANAGKIAGWVEGMVGRVLPTWAEARQKANRLQAEQRERIESREVQERLDTVLALKDMLLEYRNELDDNKHERRQLQNRLYELVERYERHSASSIEVMRDMSSVLRDQGDAIRGLASRVEKVEYILAKGRDSGESSG